MLIIVRRSRGGINGKDFLLNMLQFCLNMGDTHVSPPENIKFSTSEYMRKRMHGVSMRSNIPSRNDTFMTGFIVEPKIFKVKNLFGRVRRIESDEKQRRVVRVEMGEIVVGEEFKMNKPNRVCQKPIKSSPSSC